MRVLGAVLVALGLSACYTYAPVGSSVPEPGVEVRAHLSPVQDFDVGDVTVRDVSRVEGVVYEATSDSVSVWGQWLYSQLGNRYDPRGAVFYMDRGKVPMLETRKLHPFRTVVAVAVGLGIGYGVFDFLADPGDEGNNDGRETPTFRLIPYR